MLEGGVSRQSKLFWRILKKLQAILRFRCFQKMEHWRVKELDIGKWKVPNRG